ncbi:putative pre-mRNA-splicing factor ATP-dependent RNA helicase DHX16 [Drosophila busckii]|uniref:putative pre-mRNA-splicing factor ATP-dependent RNA helicase DHX16 n=1 Tax=Drosophila busckii TaxID=30019 RepID=UPI0014330BD4|nr:putative pre-mRNA-splicing factor ATP-dependent RNA helicase DHX16 [Drosophila busckii]
MKKYSHRRSPPIKSVYKSHFREQMASKDCTKMDTIEPPPPGFEALQIGSLTKIDKTNKKNLSEISRNAGNNARNLSSIGHHFRSLTPPSISSTKTEYVRNTPDRKENTLGKVDKNQTAKFSKSDNEDLVLLTANTGSNIIPEPKTKLSLELKDKKKKKREKSERKRFKKDKKSKKEKTKKLNICSSDRAQNGLNVLLQNKTNCTSPDRLTKILSNENVCSPIQTDSINSLHTEEWNEHINKDKSISEYVNQKIEVSKWELEDNNQNINSFDSCKSVSCNQVQELTEITSDVIRKAENAIFAKAINAIRPVELKVVIDSQCNSKDRSISFTPNQKDHLISPKHNINKSVKERLGSKVVLDQKYSSDKFKSKRKDVAGKNVKDTRHSFKSENHISKKKTDSKDCSPFNKRYEDQQIRMSNERGLSSTSKKETFINDNIKVYSKDMNSISNRLKGDTNNFEFDRNASVNFKSGEVRLASSITSKPCRPDNPFRKFDDSFGSSNVLSNFENSLKRAGSLQSCNQIGEKRQNEKKRKKTKNFKRSSSLESIKCDKKKDIKNKKKIKVMKKKKKSKK